MAERAFRGAEFLYTLKLPSGARLLCLAPSHHNYALGQRIGIRLDRPSGDVPAGGLETAAG